MAIFINAPYSKELEDYSKELGFSQIYFFQKDFIYVEEKSFKEIQKKINIAKKQKKKIIVRPSSEADLRSVLEKTKAEFVIGVEYIHPKDSLHYVRGGLDQILCNIAQMKDKTIIISLNDLFKTKNQAKAIARIRSNLRLCKKYKVKLHFTTFVNSKEEIKSYKDILAFKRILEKSVWSCFFKLINKKINKVDYLYFLLGRWYIKMRLVQFDIVLNLLKNYRRLHLT